MPDDDLHKASPSVGDKLKSLRGQKNLGTSEVAARLHLDSRIIEALERDDYGALPDPIYVRGYIRSYSKLLGHDADELVAAYNSQKTADEPEIVPEIKYPAQTSSSDKPVKAFTYLISLLLAVLLIAWWQSTSVVEQPPADSTAALPDTGSTGPLLNNIDTAGASYSEWDNTPLLVPDEGDSLINNEPPDIDSTADDPEPGVQAVREETVLPDPGTDAVPNTGMLPEAGAAEPEAAASVMEEREIEINPLSGDPEDTIVLKVAADSWIEIIDANDEKLYFDLARSGDTITVHGTAPFDVLLGFSQGVTVEFNGEYFDQAPYSRSGIARFTLGD